MLEFAVLVDKFSLGFLFTVGFISSSIFVFSMSYMSHEKFFWRFHALVLRFVISIVFLIIRPNLVRILLGWDGLGVTSYLLVIYFQSAKSYNAGMITALSNRVGDVLILSRIALWSFNGSWGFSITALSQQPYTYLPAVLLLVAACTKRAQIPFSAWLPAAMAAPTPVSSLVHSSTLVTAGVYLLFRFCPRLLGSPAKVIILGMGALTMVMAGLAALIEMDIKKIVALSTLRQLGVIITTLGRGAYSMAFFHLLSHAFFKALLFMTVGAFIHMSSDYQDLRLISLNPQTCLLTMAISLRANLSLCGLPFFRGFYSKDLCIELFLRGAVPAGLVFVIYVATGLTAAYTIRFIGLVFFTKFQFNPRI